MKNLPRSYGLSVLVACMAAAAGCSQVPNHAAPAASSEPVAAAPAKPDVIASHVDATVNPGDDFFSYANGTWLKNNPIPASEGHWGIDRVVAEDLYANLRKISENAAQSAGAIGSDEQKIGD